VACRKRSGGLSNRGEVNPPLKTFTQNDPLTDAELDRLGDFPNGGRAMNVEALDGSEQKVWVFSHRQGHATRCAIGDPDALGVSRVRKRLRLHSLTKC
jgi:hypothetical protein